MDHNIYFSRHPDCLYLPPSDSPPLEPPVRGGTAGLLHLVPEMLVEQVSGGPEGDHQPANHHSNASAQVHRLHGRLCVWFVRIFYKIIYRFECLFLPCFFVLFFIR